MENEKEIFLYTQYRDAARRHLTACKKLIETYPEWRKKCNQHEEKQIFNEIFYISGYILEGFVNYAIFCHPRWDSSLNVKEIDKQSLFSKETHLWWNGKNPYGFTIAGHNFQNNITILHRCGYVVGIPYLSPDEPLHDDKIIRNRLRKIIGEWKPDIRYEKVKKLEKLNLEYSDVSNLINLCIRISNGIRNNLR